MCNHRDCEYLYSCSSNNHLPAAAYLQAYGRCFWNQTAAFLGDKEKYRKPTPPPRPQWCYCKDKSGHQEVCGQHRDKQDCQVPSYPNEFDHNHQFCRWRINTQVIIFS